MAERNPNIKMLLALSGFNIPTGLDKLTREQQRLLRKMEGRLPKEDLEEVYKRLVKPPLDMRKLMELGVSGPDLGKAQEHARGIILRAPFIKPKDLLDKVVREMALIRRVASKYLTRRLS